MGRYVTEGDSLTVLTVNEKNEEEQTDYTVRLEENTAVLVCQNDGTELTLNAVSGGPVNTLVGEFADEAGNKYQFGEDGIYECDTLVKGSALTILAFKSALGDIGGYLVCIGIVLFAFSTILGWEYHGEKAFEYLFGTYKYNMVYRIVFSLIVYVGATTALDLVWNFSDIANALMAIPNLICLLALSGVVAKDAKEFQKKLKEGRK